MQVCYNYNVHKAPVWYQNNWIQHLMWAETYFQRILLLGFELYIEMFPDNIFCKI